MSEAIITTMESFNDYIVRVSQYIPTVIEQLKEENEMILPEILNFVEGVEWIIEVNEKLGSLGYTNSIPKEDLIRLLNEVVDSIEIKDYSTAADIFEYEIVEIIKNINKYSMTTN